MKKQKSLAELAQESVVTLQIGQRRDTDYVVPIVVNKTMGKYLKKKADGNGVVHLDAKDFAQALDNFERPVAMNMGSFDQVDISERVQQMAEDTASQAVAEINILDEANKIIYGEREQAYGNPRFNLDTIAQLWSVYIQRLFYSYGIGGAAISAEDVAQLMILLKTARLIHNPTHVDSLVDQAGYAALQHRIQGIKP